MAVIPKKVNERISKGISKFKKVLHIAKSHDVNESDTVSIINDMIGEIFGYDKYIECTSELAIRGTYCDLAIKVDEKIQFLIEAKAIGLDLKDSHLKQAIDYGANKGVQWVILTNSIEWNLYRIRFEKPINYDLVAKFNFEELNDKDVELLFLISKEGLQKNARDDYYEKIQSVNKYVIGALILNEPVLSTLRRELRKIADGIKIDFDEIKDIIVSSVLKRDVFEGEDADVARSKIDKFYKKSMRRQKASSDKSVKTNKYEEKSISEQLLEEDSEQKEHIKMI